MQNPRSNNDLALLPSVEDILKELEATHCQLLKAHCKLSAGKKCKPVKADPNVSVEDDIQYLFKKDKFRRKGNINLHGLSKCVVYFYFSSSDMIHNIS